MDKKSNYQLKVGKQGQQQLSGLDATFGEETRRFLTDLGIHPGMHIADIGCGSGHVAFWIAEQVGPTGKVTAIDSSIEQLQLAEKIAKQRELHHIEFKQASVLDLQPFVEQFDLTYCRWLLTHIRI